MDSAKEVKAVQIEADKQGVCSCKVTPEMIRAMIPMFLGGIGLVIAFAALFVPMDEKSDAKWSSAFGLAGTAIGGAAGLAQSRPEINNNNPKL